VCVPVSYGCCVLSGRGFCVELITRPQESCDCGVSECDREASIMRRTSPTRVCYAMEKKKTPPRLNSWKPSAHLHLVSGLRMHAACFNTPCTHRPRAWCVDRGICMILCNLHTVCIMNAAICIFTCSVSQKATAATQYQGRRINFISSTVHNSHVWKKQEFRRTGRHVNFCEI